VIFFFSMYISLVCTFQKAIEIVEVRVDEQERALGLIEKNKNRCVSFIQFTFYELLSYDNNPQ
jgi:hypothetical protein